MKLLPNKNFVYNIDHMALFKTLNDFANVICICILRKAKSAICVEIKRKKMQMRKKINTYFGNAYVRYFRFFSWCENMTCNNACNTDEITLFFINLCFMIS